ncbi:SixA phosphatase family protein [Marilutibacter chinensis]|uniref:Histidine phosphatase family protein n=1 Tax=Marilutibacter chinensis TaxID=2912247 RepID=A0ABS9HRX1_9GAMM|nr:phosphoglycerate mutase family protein [Lysobacter chinensis]MCF7221082.1 histidine phosphatase family protein [Lysobacter chinensis]
MSRSALLSHRMQFHCMAALALALTACTTSGHTAKAEPQASRFVIVRHAEKQSGDAATARPDDPALTDAGRERAVRLAASLVGDPVVAVYATPYRRTRDTASPTARMHGLQVSEYDPHQPASALVDALRTAHPHGTVLVVGHSNTVPAIASALCGCEIAPIGEDEYDHRHVIDIDRQGRARLGGSPAP